MKKYLLPAEGNFYKANMHCHTVLSDGNLTPAEIKSLYKSKGYSIVAFTDHDIFIPHPELSDDKFLALHGFEAETNEPYDGRTFDLIRSVHYCAIALHPQTEIQPCWHRSDYFFANAIENSKMVKFDESQPDYERVCTGEGISDHMQKIRDAGFFVTYNHPTWSLESYPNYTAYDGMHAMEIFNGISSKEGFDDYNPRVYDDMLRAGKRIYCIGGDDNHNSPVRRGTRYDDAGVAFTMIKSPSLTYEDVTKSLLAGEFYASEAPEIYELWYEDGQVHIKCSAADRINYNTGRRRASVTFDESGEGVTEATFAVSAADGYFRITVTNKQGNRACTNAYFTDSL